MITSVATWRCKCNATVKVITETDRAKIGDVERLIAQCPNCGDEQIVLAHRIISTDVQKNDAAARLPTDTRDSGHT